LDEAVEYIAQDSLEAAQGFLLNTLEAASSLSILSERGRVVPEVADPAVREVHKYRLIYEVRPSQVEILAFLHGARDFAEWRTQE
jgi:plasmid stabilization system protein ParE